MEKSREVSHPVVEWIESGVARKIAYAVAAVLGVAWDDREDLFQSLAVALLAHGLSQLVNSTYVYRTAFHKGIDLRAQKVLPLTMSPAPTHVPELSQLLHARASNLPAPLPLIYRLRYSEGCTHSEIAEKLHLSRSAVRRLEARLLRSL